MKKGLLTVLLASLVLVGCQNYDDQFDDLNAQISALKSQVDGLSSLSGQVSSLSGTISGLQSGIAAAQAAATSAGSSADAATAAVNAIPGVDLSGLTASLATLQAEVDAIEAAIATTATAAEVAALQTSLTAVETDLADLLTSNNVYATDISITTAAGMASALALGNKVALMNANVTIEDSATISDTDIQTFVDRIKTMNGTFTYDSKSATGFVPTFDEMVAGTVFAITPAGPVSFKKLASATTVTITTTYSTKITSLDMSALTSVTSFNTGTVNQLHLSSATNVDLGALPRYGTALSIQTKKGATLDIGLLDDVTTLGVLAPMTLTLNGPDSVTLSKINDGTITLSNIGTATVSNFYGILDIDAGVETLTTTDSVFIALDGATDLVTATLDYKYDWDPLLTTANAAISAAGYSTTYLDDYSTPASIGGTALKTLTITGDLLDLYLDEANLETLSINANMTDLTMATLTDLTSLTVAGGKIGNISLTDSPNISVADFNHTTNLENKGSATANTSVSFVVTNNLGLTKLHTTGDLIHTFTVTGNDALTELDMTGLKTRGTETTGGAVNLWDNDLTAVKSTDTSDGETNKADGATGDTGSTDDGTSGMDTMKVYLTAIAADATNTAQVNFDTVSTFDDSETTTTTTSLNVTGSTAVSATINDATVLKMTPSAVTTAAVNALPVTTQKSAWYVNQTTSGGKVQFTINGVSVPSSLYALTGNPAVDAGNIASAANVTLASNAGVVLDAKVGGHSTGSVTLNAYANTAETTVDERYTSAAVSVASTTTGTVWTVGAEDEFTFTVGLNSVTASTGGYSVSGTAIADIEEAIVAAWAAKYGSSGTASLSAIATMADDGDGILEFTMLQTDSGGYGVDIDFSVADKSANPTGTDTSSRTAGNIGYKIGATRSTGDNSTIGGENKSLIVTIASKNSGTLNNSIASGVTTYTGAVGSAAASMVAYTTTYRANTAGNGIGTYAGVSQPRTDVVVAEETVAGTAAVSSTAVSYNRVTWLG